MIYHIYIYISYFKFYFKCFNNQNSDLYRLGSSISIDTIYRSLKNCYIKLLNDYRTIIDNHRTVNINYIECIEQLHKPNLMVVWCIFKILSLHCHCQYIRAN